MRSPAFTRRAVVNALVYPPLMTEYLLLRYAAVTQNNGQQEILDGGKTYMLTHRNWRFEKFLTCKIQTNDLKGWVYQSGLADLKSDLSRFYHI